MNRRSVISFFFFFFKGFRIVRYLVAFVLKGGRAGEIIQCN